MKTADLFPDPKVRGLMLHDGLAFLVLTLATVALYGVTSLLFRSFESRREALGRSWSERGREALQGGDPKEAVTALRTALTYAPDDRGDQMLLAQALARAGYTDEATSYFLNLWESRPGDGFINLQLARLASQRHRVQEATDYYRASIFGTWSGDGVTRRREVRLELADFLIAHRDPMAARSELLIAAGNAPPDAKMNLLFGDKLQLTGDPGDAMTLYRKAIEDEPWSSAPLERAGRTAYAMGDYAEAEKMLARALQTRGDGELTEARRTEVATLHASAVRLLELSLSPELPVRERLAHLRVAEGIAQSRLKACTAQIVVGNSGQIQELQGRWKSAAEPAVRRALAGDVAVQDNVVQLIRDTEGVTAQVCGAPSGDDALLLLLAQRRTGVGDGN